MRSPIILVRRCPRSLGLQLVSHGDLAAVCAPAADGDETSPDGLATAELLWRHERVVEALMEDRDLLPVRYGTRVTDEDAAVKALDANHDRLLESLARVRGAVEIAVRVLDADPDPVSPAEKPTTGTGYLRAKAGQLRVHDDALRAVHEPLSAVSRAQTTRPTALPGELLHAAYLVDHDGVEKFSSVVERLQKGPSIMAVDLHRPVAALQLRRAMSDDKFLTGPPDLDFLAGSLPSIDDALPRRLNADPENLERGSGSARADDRRAAAPADGAPSAAPDRRRHPVRRADRTAGPDIHEAGRTNGSSCATSSASPPRT